MGACNNNEPQQTTTSIPPAAASCRDSVCCIDCIAVHDASTQACLLKKFWPLAEDVYLQYSYIILDVSLQPTHSIIVMLCALCISSLLMRIQHQSTMCLLLRFERPTYSRPPFRKRWGRPPWEDASSYLNDYHFGGITVFPNVGIRKVLFQYWKG